ncbi:MAG: phosphatase PAP2 family protein [Solirubrobacteraceae bacterium]
MDRSLLHAINDVAWRHDWLGDAFEAYAKGSEALFAVLVLTLLIVGIRRRAALHAGLLAGASAAGALLVAVVLAKLVDRPRPFVADPGRIHLLVKHAGDPGFPSDHATAAFAIATALFLCDRRAGLVALLAALLLAVDRVAVGVHYPADVLAGAVLGAAVAIAVHRLTPLAAGWVTRRRPRAQPSP